MKIFKILNGDKVESSEECRGCYLNNNRINEFLNPIYEDDNILICQDMENPIPAFYIISTKKHINSILQIDEKIRNDLSNLLYIVRKGMNEKLGIEKTIIIQEEKDCASHFHIWVLPIWNKDEKVRIIEGNVKKYIESFEFNKTSEKILDCNNIMKKYIKQYLSDNKT